MRVLTLYGACAALLLISTCQALPAPSPHPNTLVASADDLSTVLMRRGKAPGAAEMPNSDQISMATGMGMGKGTDPFSSLRRFSSQVYESFRASKTTMLTPWKRVLDRRKERLEKKASVKLERNEELIEGGAVPLTASGPAM